MKSKLIQDLTKLKEASGTSNFLIKRYKSWIKIIENEESISPELQKFLYSKASHIQEHDSEYSKFIYSLAES